MAAAKKKHSRKGKKGAKRSIFSCFLGACFGISSKVSVDQYGDGKLVKHATPWKTATVNDQRSTTTTSSREIVSLKKEIDDALDGEEKGSQVLALPAYEVTDNKTHDPPKLKIKNSNELGRITSSIKRVDKQRSTNWNNPTSSKLSHSVSLPVLKRYEEIKPAGGGERGKNGNRMIRAGGEFDSRVGALILITTLIVMLIWGKMWAIVATAAWFYFLPRVRARIDESYTIKSSISGMDRIDLDSREYKKKVVLQGLLQRNVQQV